eukprot:766192-Hanusia_phi.AAC.2
MHNVDFPLADMDSGAPWLRRAATENYEYGLAMREVKDALEAKGVQQTTNGDARGEEEEEKEEKE